MKSFFKYLGTGILFGVVSAIGQGVVTGDSMAANPKQAAATLVLAGVTAVINRAQKPHHDVE